MGNTNQKSAGEESKDRVIKSNESSRTEVSRNKNFLKICEKQILDNLLDCDVESLKDVLEHNYLCEASFPTFYTGKFKRTIKIKKKNFDKCKNFKSEYFSIKLSRKDDEDLSNSDYECTFKFHKNNIIQCIAIVIIVKKFIDKKFNALPMMNLIYYLKKCEIGDIFAYQDTLGNTFAHILAMYDQMDIAKFYTFTKEHLMILNKKNSTPFLESKNNNRKSLTSKYFNSLLTIEIAK